jgi:hypothetical protein
MQFSGVSFHLGKSYPFFDYLKFTAMRKTNFHIDSNDSIAEIKRRFSDTCPNYYIDFFTNDAEGPSNYSCAMYTPQVRMRDMIHQFRSGIIEINDQMKIEEIEHLFYDHFKLHVQVSPLNPGKQNRVVTALPDFLKEKSYHRMSLPERFGPVSMNYHILR